GPEFRSLQGDALHERAFLVGDAHHVHTAGVAAKVDHGIATDALAHHARTEHIDHLHIVAVALQHVDGEAAIGGVGEHADAGELFVLGNGDGHVQVQAYGEGVPV